MDEDKMIKDMMEFLQCAMESVKSCEIAEFECPICGGRAHAGKSEHNGHVHAYCDNCDGNFMQ